MSYGAGGWEIKLDARRLENAARLGEQTSRAARRTELRLSTKLQFRRANRCQALVNIVAKAADQVKKLNLSASFAGSSIRATAVIDDLESVLIGTSLSEGRGKGPFFAGNITGAIGFKQNLRDQWNQIQHATAGLVIGYRYGKVGEWLARWLEDEPQDDLLYEATCPVGRWLNWNTQHYDQLAEKLRIAIGDGTCLPPQLPP